MSYCLAEGVLTQKLGSQVVLMHVLKGQYFELNDTGAMVLEAILAGADEIATTAQLSQRFDVDQISAQADVLALIKNLIDRELLSLK